MCLSVCVCAVFFKQLDTIIYRRLLSVAFFLDNDLDIFFHQVYGLRRYEIALQMGFMELTVNAGGSSTHLMLIPTLAYSRDRKMTRMKNLE